MFNDIANLAQAIRFSNESSRMSRTRLRTSPSETVGESCTRDRHGVSPQSTDGRAFHDHAERLAHGLVGPSAGANMESQMTR